MKVYNRKEQKYQEISQYGGKMLEILYESILGRALLKFVIHPFFSRIYGIYNDSKASKKRIAPFVEKYGIELDDYVEQEYRCFNDFFIRKIKDEKRPVSMEKKALVSPADSKLSVYPITSENRIRIKGIIYTLKELVGNRTELKKYEEGLCLVFRLSMEDYHHYIFADSGRVSGRYYLKGKLHTVSSLSKEYKIYQENTRVVNKLQTQNFGQVIMIEVGALLVGRIVNYPIRKFEKGMEKGYFKLGGSTIVMLFQKGSITLDEDIMEKCLEGTEVKVLMGETIGRKND